jgi:SAM-dependent methyltransferase
MELCLHSRKQRDIRKAPSNERSERKGFILSSILEISLLKEKKLKLMRRTIKEFVCIVAKDLPIEEPILEFGSLQVAGQEGFADLRHFFRGKQYIGADMREGPGVDKILNLHNIDLPSEHVGTVLCLDTLEHVEYPRRALKEIHRILRPDGIAIISSVMNFPIHDYPYDYWRFTPEAFKSLLKPFASSFVGSVGIEDFPHTVVGVGFKGNSPSLSQFDIGYNAWKASQEFHAGLSIFEWIRKLITPPILSRKGRKALGLTRRSI